MYENELCHLYELIDKISEYFKLINFDGDYKEKKRGESVAPSPLIGGKSYGSKSYGLKMSKASSNIPKLINFSTKAVGAKEAYKEFLRQKAKDFSRIETDYFHIKEMCQKTLETKIDSALILSEENSK